MHCEQNTKRISSKSSRRGTGNGFLAKLIGDKIPVVKFELREPSLHEIFIEKVGDANEEK